MEYFCIYCLRRDHLSNAHLFPQVIGGKVSGKYCCAYCNSAIGKLIEGKIKSALFFAKAIDCLNINPEKNPYSDIQIVDGKEGHKLKYENGKFTSKIRETQKKERSGSREDIIKSFKKYVKRKFPNWEEYCMSELRKGSDVIIKLPGEIHTFKEKIDKSKVNMSGKIVFPNDLLAKLCFESMWCFGFFTDKSLINFYLDTFEIVQEDNITKQIKVKENFIKRIRPLNDQILRNSDLLNVVDFGPLHTIAFFVTPNDIAYITVKFFGVLSFLVIIGDITRDEISNVESIGKRYVFPINKSEIQYLEVENYSVIDAFADAIWHIYNEDSPGGSEDPPITDRD